MKRMKKVYSLFILLIIVLVAIPFVFNSKFRPTVNQNMTVKDSSLINPDIKLAYGLPADSFEITKSKIQKNAFLGDILESSEIPAQIITKIEKAAKGIFDFRKIKAGNIFAILKPKKAENAPSYLVYEHTPTEYYIVEITDSVTVQKREKETVTFHKNVSGTITSSLWNAMEEQKINPMVAIELSEIFAWTIDFFGLQQGDAFKIMYDEEYVDSMAIGIGEIHGAWFRHAGKEFTAIPFEQDGKIEFFDAEGNSLRKAFLKAPLRFSRISSRFTGSRYHPVLKRYTTHYGVDYAAPSGTPVLSIGDGVVISAGWSGGGGNMVKIRHNSVYSTAYLHLKAYGSGIRAGTYVRQGDVIGYVGSTGLSTGPHLDFRVWKNNAPVNPLTLESPSVEPVKKEQMDAFLAASAEIVMGLNNIQLRGTGDENQQIYALKGKCSDSELF